MQNYRHKTRHETVNVEGLDIFYRRAGDPEKPAILLLHGYPELIGDGYRSADWQANRGHTCW